MFTYEHVIWVTNYLWASASRAGKKYSCTDDARIKVAPKTAFWEPKCCFIIYWEANGDYFSATRYRRGCGKLFTSPVCESYGCHISAVSLSSVIVACHCHLLSSMSHWPHRHTVTDMYHPPVTLCHRVHHIPHIRYCLGIQYTYLYLTVMAWRHI